MNKNVENLYLRRDTWSVRLPGARIESPSFQPIISRILDNTTLSIRMKTGAIS